MADMGMTPVNTNTTPTRLHRIFDGNIARGDNHITSIIAYVGTIVGEKIADMILQNRYILFLDEEWSVLRRRLYLSSQTCHGDAESVTVFGYCPAFDVKPFRVENFGQTVVCERFGRRFLLN